MAQERHEKRLTSCAAYILGNTCCGITAISGDFLSACGASEHSFDGCHVLDTSCWTANEYHGKEFVFKDACLTLFGTRSV